MTMTRKYLLAVVMIFAVAAIGLAGVVRAEPPVIRADSVAEATQVYSLPVVIEQLDAYYRAWARAKLDGNEDQREKLENKLYDLVNYDISVTAGKVRQLARLAVLAKGGDPDHAHPDGADRIGSPDGDRFRERLSLLKTKETIYRSLSRTDAFSNKYRLLGDYLGLLRSEQSTPRLELAGAAQDEQIDMSEEK